MMMMMTTGWIFEHLKSLIFPENRKKRKLGEKIREPVMLEKIELIFAFKRRKEK